MDSVWGEYKKHLHTWRFDRISIHPPATVNASKNYLSFDTSAASYFIRFVKSFCEFVKQLTKNQPLKYWKNLYSLFMHRIHHQLKKGILGLVDFFYPMFRRFMPLQTYRYAACGGGNTAFNILIFFFAHNFVLQNRVVDLGFVAVSSHIAAFIIAFCITFPIGFYLSMYVVFQGSFLRRRTQFVRYFMVAMACIGMNYFFLKLFVDVFGWYPTPSMILNTAIVVIFSYLAQKHFSFRAQKIEVPLDMESPSEMRA